MLCNKPCTSSGQLDAKRTNDIPAVNHLPMYRCLLAFVTSLFFPSLTSITGESAQLPMWPWYAFYAKLTWNELQLFVSPKIVIRNGERQAQVFCIAIVILQKH